MTSESPDPAIYIGIMSGTSLDGADAILAEFSSANTHAHCVLGHTHAPFPADLRDELLALQTAGPNELHRSALASNALVDHYAMRVETLLDQSGIDRREVRAIGVHGQTVRHRPELSYTLQLNSPARLAELCGIDVIADFRSRDVAAGGQGAPLVPAFHAAVFGGSDRHRVVVNIGGIANLTDLPPGELKTVRGWDTGPGNGLLDLWISRERSMAYDRNGDWAASGCVNVRLLAQLSTEPWFELLPPKSTGRDLFNAAWLAHHLKAFQALPAKDIQATLAELTANTIASAIASHCPRTDEVIVCGGGAFNQDLLSRLLRMLTHKGMAEIEVVASNARGIPPDQVEALAFAWLAWRFMEGLPGNLPAVTGARGLRPLGAHYPH